MWVWPDAAPAVRVGGGEDDVVGIGPNVVQAFPRRCTVRASKWLSGAGVWWTCVPPFRFHWFLSLGVDELLTAVDVIGCAREGGVGHNVYGQRGHVRRSDHASDGKRGAKLVAPFF